MIARGFKGLETRKNVSVDYGKAVDNGCNNKNVLCDA